MSTISVSYNFPPEFLWGSSAGETLLTDKESHVLLYRLREYHIDALSFYLNWPDFEPLKGNYNEALIDSARNLFSRILSQNIKTFIILDIGEIPHWQNMENKKTESFYDEQYRFVTHFADAIVPYISYIGFCFSFSALYSGKKLREEAEFHNRLREYIQKISDQVKVGSVIPPGSGEKKKGVFPILLRQNKLTGIKNIGSDFIAFPAEKSVSEEILSALEDDKKPLLIYTDKLGSAAPAMRAEILTDRIFSVWKDLYQKGFPVIGYFSETDMDSETPEKELYSSCCQKNALEISTENRSLSEKWIRFLKD